MPDESACYAEFPKFEEAPHSIEYLSLTSQSIQRVVSLDSNYVENYGSVYVIRKWEGGRPQPGRKVTIEVYDVRLGKLLWSRDFAKSAPWLMGRSGEDSLILLWNLSSSEAWDEIQTLPLWKERFRSVSHDRGNYLIEIVEAQTGKPLGALAIATGNLSFHVVRGSAGGGWVVLTDNQNRLHLYALASGEEKGTLFG